MYDTVTPRIFVSDNMIYNSAHNLTDEQKKEKIKYNIFYLRLKNKYIDMTDVQNPFKYYVIDEQITFSYNWELVAEVFLKKNGNF